MSGYSSQTSLVDRLSVNKVCNDNEVKQNKQKREREREENRKNRKNRVWKDYEPSL